jgi:glycosyltransferase involved in cell wall biosynthesis
MQKVCILLGTCDGERFLAAQLESLVCQTHTNWHLTVSDDSTSPNCARVLADFAQKVGHDRVRVMRGPRRGVAQNYLFLLSQIPVEVPFVALCDQDDVWMPDKLSRAVACMTAAPCAEAVAFFAGRLICDAELQPQKAEQAPRRPASFRNALIQNILPGNTIVMNRKAADLCACAAASAQGIIAHDWWIYQMITGGAGRILYDPRPAVLYRQHDRNAIGANAGMISAFRRGLRALRGQSKLWSDAHMRALTAVSGTFSPENQSLMLRYARARAAPFWQRMFLMQRLGLYRQSRTGQAFYWLQTLTGRI